MSNYVKLKDVEINFLNMFQNAYRRPSSLNHMDEKAYFIDFLSNKSTNISGLASYEIKDLSTSYEMFNVYWNKKTSLSINEQVASSLIEIDDQYVTSYYFFMLLYMLKGYYQSRRLDLNLKMVFAFEDFSKTVSDIFTSNTLIGNVIFVLSESLNEPEFQYYEDEALKNELYTTLYDYHIKKSIEEPSSMSIYFQDAIKRLGIDKITTTPYLDVKKDLLDVKQRVYDFKNYLLLDNRLKSLWFFNKIDDIISLGGSFSYKGFVFKIVPLTQGEYTNVRKDMTQKGNVFVGDYINLLLDTFLRAFNREKALKMITKISATLIVGSIAYFVFKKRG